MQHSQYWIEMFQIQTLQTKPIYLNQRKDSFVCFINSNDRRSKSRLWRDILLICNVYTLKMVVIFFIYVVQSLLAQVV